MTRARILADYVSSGDELALKAPITNAALVTPNLGTPSAGVMTNVTGMPLAGLSATGTAGATTFLRGDNSWQTAGSTDASSLTSGTLGNTVQDNITRLGTLTTGNFDTVFPFTSTAQNIGKLRIVQGVGTFDDSEVDLSSSVPYIGYYNEFIIAYTGFASAPKIFWSTYSYVYHDLIHAGTSNPSDTGATLRIAASRAVTVKDIPVAWIAVGTAS